MGRTFWLVALLLLWVLAPFVVLRLPRLRKVDCLRRVRAAYNNPRIGNYLIADLRCLPEQVFGFLLDDDLFAGEDATVIEYPALRPDFAEILRQVDADIAERRYFKVRVFALSAGDVLARCMSLRYSNSRELRRYQLETYEINPCAFPKFVLGDLLPWLQAMALALHLLCFTLGPLSLIPLHGYSLNAFTWQAWTIAFGRNTLIRKFAACGESCIRDEGGYYTGMYDKGEAIKLALMSERDVFLDNCEIRYYFACEQRGGHEVRKAYVPSAEYAETINRANDYKACVKVAIKQGRS